MNYELGRAFQVFTVMLAGGVVGIGSALLAVELVYKSETVVSGPWRSAPDAALVAENRWARTAAALSGTWLPAGGGVREWTALDDSQGDRLKGDCTYYLSGKPTAAGRWSITLYNNDHILPAGGTGPASIPSTTVLADSQGSVQIQAGGPDQGGAWLQAEPGSFSLTFRHYGTADGAEDASPPFFAIDRGECR